MSGLMFRTLTSGSCPFSSPPTRRLQQRGLTRQDLSLSVSREMYLLLQNLMDGHPLGSSRCLHGSMEVGASCCLPFCVVPWGWWWGLGGGAAWEGSWVVQCRTGNRAPPLQFFVGAGHWPEKVSCQPGLQAGRTPSTTVCLSLCYLMSPLNQFLLLNPRGEESSVSAGVRGRVVARLVLLGLQWASPQTDKDKP